MKKIILIFSLLLVGCFRPPQDSRLLNQYEMEIAREVYFIWTGVQPPIECLDAASNLLIYWGETEEEFYWASGDGVFFPRECTSLALPGECPAGDRPYKLYGRFIPNYEGYAGYIITNPLVERHVLAHEFVHFFIACQSDTGQSDPEHNSVMFNVVYNHNWTDLWEQVLEHRREM